MRLRAGDRLLALGCNDGRELEVFNEVAGLDVWGVDASPQAIAAARARWPGQRFVAGDLRDWEALGVPAAQGLLMLNLLQCTTLDRDALLTRALKALTPRASVLISIPNCHFFGADIARRPEREDPRHDRGIVAKDLRYLTRALFRAGFTRITSFGTYDAFLLARRG